MREIKFKYIYGDGKSIFTRCFTLGQIESGAHFDEICDDPQLKDFKIIGRYQYAEQKDKNDVEIYEGDICKTETSAFKADDNTIAEVMFYDGKFMRKVYYSDTSYGYHDLFAKHCEVIGNKFENPELLDIE